MKFKYFHFLFALSLLFSMASCDDPADCPDGNLCIYGNTLEYQLLSNSAKLIIENPEGAVLKNSAVEITDLIPGYPAQVDYTTPEMHFGGGMFMIEPFDIEFVKFITINIEYTTQGVTDYLGNDYRPNMRMYYINDGKWSKVNGSYCDTVEGRVKAQVLRLGTYAIACEKEIIEGDWIVPDGSYTFGYSSRIVFLHNGKGFREWVVDCNPDSVIVSYQLASDHFDYTLNSDGTLSLLDFTEAYICGSSGVQSGDLENLSYVCDETQLSIPGVGGYFRVEQ